VIHFVIPFYNSGAALAENVLAIHRFLERHLKGEFEVVLANDGSTDGSAEAAADLAESTRAVRLAGYDRNRGRGYAVRFAASTCSGGHLIFSDLDLPQTTNLNHILELLARLEDYPVVVGSRFHPESKTRRILRRDLVGRAHRLMVGLLFRELTVKDPDAGFKGFDLEKLHKMASVSRMDRWSWDLEVLVIARANGLKIAEVPIDWNERYTARASSVRLARDAWEEFRGMLRVRRNLKKGLYRFSLNSMPSR
jgi:glycosyltransferase involved in cell wall biosynthesis